MSGANDILDLIDDALTDYDVSPDAVRYGADQDVKTAYDDEVTAMTGPRVGPGVRDWASVEADMYAIRVAFTEAARRVVVASRPVIRAAFTAFAKAVPVANCAGVRCPTCSPHANPPPLPIDGHAYRRRTRTRWPR